MWYLCGWSIFLDIKECKYILAHPWLLYLFISIYIFSMHAELRHENTLIRAAWSIGIVSAWGIVWVVRSNPSDAHFSKSNLYTSRLPGVWRTPLTRTPGVCCTPLTKAPTREIKTNYWVPGPMLCFLKYFRRKIQQKNWRFWLKTKLNYAKFWS
jgi:hypothetical protein